jgi:hypothetical protein
VFAARFVFSGARKMKQPKTVDEYIDLVHQAVYEVDELMSIFGDDAEAYEGVIPLVAQLDAELRKMYDDMISGRYEFDPNGPDLPFMALADKIGRYMTFKPLLSVINQTHRYGLDVAD